MIQRADIEFRVPYSQRYLFNAIPDTNHSANPTNLNPNSKDNPNPISSTNPTNPNTRYRCEYGTINSMFADTENTGVQFRCYAALASFTSKK